MLYLTERGKGSIFFKKGVSEMNIASETNTFWVMHRGKKMCWKKNVVSEENMKSERG